jgi:hypothetical protein
MEITVEKARELYGEADSVQCSITFCACCGWPSALVRRRGGAECRAHGGAALHVLGARLRLSPVIWIYAAVAAARAEAYLPG